MLASALYFLKWRMCLCGAAAVTNLYAKQLPTLGPMAAGTYGSTVHLFSHPAERDTLKSPAGPPPPHSLPISRLYLGISRPPAYASTDQGAAEGEAPSSCLSHHRHGKQCYYLTNSRYPRALVMEQPSE